jgi:hypothetical protein
VRATTLANIVKFSMAALVLAILLSASAAFVQATATNVSAAETRGSQSTPSAPSAPNSNNVKLSSDVLSCGLGPTLPQPPTFGDPADSVQDMSKATEAYIHDCRCATQTCIADALDKYSEALAQIAPRLPPHLQNAAGIVATAAARVRVARTKKDVARALNDAIAAIHKDIELVKAEDPENPRLTRSGEFVAETLTVASLALEKGGGL